MNQEKIGKFIMERRQAKNMTQEALAQKLSITDKAISKWENGRCLPDISILDELSKELDITVNELLKGEFIEEKEIKKKTDENIKECLKEKNKINKKLNVITVGIVIFALIFPIILLTSSEINKVPTISFSSFKVMKKANSFYTFLKNNDYDNLKVMIDDSTDIWHPLASNNYTTNDFINNLKEFDLEYTKFKVNSFSWNGDNASVTYNLCFKKANDNGCIQIEIIDSSNDQILFNAKVYNANNIENKVINIFNPIWNIE